MITFTEYLKPNITIETELIGKDRFYIYNYQGLHYRVFSSLATLNIFLNQEQTSWIFECETDAELESFLYKSPLYIKKS